MIPAAQANLELIVLAHRYLYYVLAEPVISDFEYDMLERQLPEGSAIHLLIGSSVAEEYSPTIVALAKQLLEAQIK